MIKKLIQNILYRSTYPAIESLVFFDYFKLGQYQNNQFIQELVDDEDHSSFTSKNRVSELVEMADQVSNNRNSVFSVKNNFEYN